MKQKMKVIHVISSIDFSTGGPARSATLLVGGINRSSNISIELFSGYSLNPVLDCFNSPKKIVKFYKINIFGFFVGLSLSSKKNDVDVFHGNGIWQMPVHQMSVFAREKKVPYIISPRGMLEPWSLSQKRIKKKLAMFLYQRQDLALAACIHATSKMEATNIRNLGFKNPIAVIPNGIVIEPFLERLGVKGDKKKVLFLSRIHPKKGIELLLEAWSKVDHSVRSSWFVEIIGNGDKGYVNQLKEQIVNSNLQHEISLLGPQFGEEKQNSFLSADLFVLPTYSENFGLVVAEAMAYGLPVITTKGTPWQELEDFNAGWWIDIGVEPLVNALSSAMTMKSEELVAMGDKGRMLVERNYNIDVVSKQMVDLYKWVLKKGDKPDFVY